MCAISPSLEITSVVTHSQVVSSFPLSSKLLVCARKLCFRLLYYPVSRYLHRQNYGRPVHSATETIITRPSIMFVATGRIQSSRSPKVPASSSDARFASSLQHDWQLLITATRAMAPLHALTCRYQYHGWSYNAKGDLVKAPKVGSSPYRWIRDFIRDAALPSLLCVPLFDSLTWTTFLLVRLRPRVQQVTKRK